MHMLFFYEFIALHYISLAISPLAQLPQRVVFLTYLRCKLLINNAIPTCVLFSTYLSGIPIWSSLYPAY